MLWVYLGALVVVAWLLFLIPLCRMGKDED